MKLDEDFIKTILNAFEGHTDPYIPVALLSKLTNDEDNLVEEGDEPRDKYTISAKMVFHLLHLQDLGCIENLNGECWWGYNPTGSQTDSFSNLINKAIEEGEFETPHCYAAQAQDSVIRLTAVGIQIRTTLNSGLDKKIKKLVIEFGKAALPAAISALPTLGA